MDVHGALRRRWLIGAEHHYRLTLDSGVTTAAQRSSMESFLDEYQYVRLALAVAGVLFVLGYALTSGLSGTRLIYVPALVGMGLHAGWWIRKGVRSPASMLVLDLTAWGLVMVVATEMAMVDVASLAFMSVLPVLFAPSYLLMGLMLAYVASLYGMAYFAEVGVSGESVGIFLAILLTVGGIDAVMVRIRMWLGRLDANRSQMLGTVSHELRNSLTGVLGATEVMVDDEGDFTHEEGRELMELAHRQAVDATEIVDDLLVVSRIEGSALSLQVDAVDVDRQIDVVVRRSGGDGMIITVEIEEGLPQVVGDSLRIRQVLRNLVSNAEAYGGPSIRLDARRTGHGVEVTVADDGDGVGLEDETSLFLPYRHSVASRRSETSVGLGLWICRQLAHAMGGRLHYERVDSWTRFVLTLPVWPEARGRRGG